MKPLKPFSLLLLFALLVGCGAGHPKITSISVSPTSANAAVNMQATFTATANFDNHTSRQLTQADGLTWKSSNNAAAGINNDGTATCITLGTVTVTASAPSQLVVMVGTQISSNSPMVSGTGTLNCT